MCFYFFHWCSLSPATCPFTELSSDNNISWVLIFRRDVPRLYRISCFVAVVLFKQWVSTALNVISSFWSLFVTKGCQFIRFFLPFLCYSTFALSHPLLSCLKSTIDLIGGELVRRVLYATKKCSENSRLAYIHCINIFFQYVLHKTWF